MKLRALFLAIACLGLSEPVDVRSDLFSKSLEELLETRITTLTKNENPYAKVPASVQIISKKDLMTFPGEKLTDVLRYIVGAQAFDIDKNDKIFSLRGSASQFSNKLQVLINGQSITSFPFSGVFWSEFDIPLTWIDRIEIIRGQHGSVWGSNNVNGIVNIILKSPEDNYHNHGSSSSQVSFGFLSDKPRVDLVSNHQINTTNITLLGNVSVYRDSEDTEHPSAETDDDSNNSRFGILASKESGDWRFSTNLFRFDSSKDRTVIRYYPFVDNGVYKGSGDFGATLFAVNAERNLGWGRLGLSYDIAKTENNFSFVRVDDLTQNLGAKLVYEITEDLRLTVGGSYRHVDEDNHNSEAFAFMPTERIFTVRRVFTQLEQEFFDDKGIGIFSLALERNSFTGSNLPYNARIGYSINDSVFSWMSVGKAYRLPSRIERDMVYAFRLFDVGDDIRIPGVLYGNDRVLDESAVGVELGSRFHVAHSTLIDITLFKYWYDNLVTFSPRSELAWEPLYESLVIPIDLENNATSTAYGGEAMIKWFADDLLRFEAGYAFLFAKSELSDYHKDDILFVEPELRAPKHSLVFRPVISYGEFTVDSVLRYWSPNLFNPEGPLWTLDVGVTYDFTEQDSVKVVARNLVKTNDFEAESFAGYTVAKDVPREIGIYYTRRF